jgi:hypothetical protein
MRKNYVTIVQFAPTNWVVEGIGKMVNNEHCSLLTQSKVAIPYKRHHLQSKTATVKQGQPLQPKRSHQQSRAIFDSHNHHQLREAIGKHLQSTAPNSSQGKQ